MNEGAYSGPERFFIGNASPRELLTRAESGDSKATAEVYKLGRNAAYADTLYSELQIKRGTKRRVLFKVMANGPGEFRRSLMTAAKKDSGDGFGKIVTGSIGVPFAAGLLGLTAISQSSNFSSVFMCLLFAFMAYSSCTSVVEGVKKIQRAKEAKGHLQ